MLNHPIKHAHKYANAQQYMYKDYSFALVIVGITSCKLAYIDHHLWKWFMLRHNVSQMDYTHHTY